MRNYSRKFRRNYRGGWPFDTPEEQLAKAKANVEDANKKLEEAQTKVNSSSTSENSDPGIVQQAEFQATNAFNKVTSMLPSFSASNNSNETPQNGGKPKRRFNKSTNKVKYGVNTLSSSLKNMIPQHLFKTSKKKRRR